MSNIESHKDSRDGILDGTIEIKVITDGATADGTISCRVKCSDNTIDPPIIANLLLLGLHVVVKEMMGNDYSREKALERLTEAYRTMPEGASRSEVYA